MGHLKEELHGFIDEIAPVVLGQSPTSTQTLATSDVNTQYYNVVISSLTEAAQWEAHLTENGKVYKVR